MMTLNSLLLQRGSITLPRSSGKQLPSWNKDVNPQNPLGVLENYSELHLMADSNMYTEVVT